ncbi:hypothetical protein [Xenorhabdus szentirmaii]|uniref:hypothetical protein n=1 Tax=Xenorhabdus szentirmaii TaxID=290112 RepID=UPI001996F147|nr:MULTISPECIES: hypothetical protein [unclassified Xenorhabdus]MBD2780660.1 hypothetical protein [Xenorhabdus sp. 38]MBD2803161.1 hypothetical protein [Xenorhabdus sp. ZM]
MLEHAPRPIDAGHYDNISELFTDAKALSTELTQHLSEGIDEYYQEQTQVWEEQAKATSSSETIVIKETQLAFILVSATALIIAATIGFMLFSFSSGGDFSGLWIGFIAAVLSPYVHS